MDCQRVAEFCIKFEKEGRQERVFCCHEHLLVMLRKILIVRYAGSEVTVALHPLANEEPCELGVE
jgi:hypothetical protein